LIRAFSRVPPLYSLPVHSQSSFFKHFPRGDVSGFHGGVDFFVSVLPGKDRQPSYHLLRDIFLSEIFCRADLPEKENFPV